MTERQGGITLTVERERAHEEERDEDRERGKFTKASAECSEVVSIRVPAE